jgi:hypothetical protein
MNTEDIEVKFPYSVKTYHDYNEVSSWCEQQFGEFGVHWYRYGTDIAMGIVAGAPLYDHYRFAHSEDATLFVLRWT